MSAKVAFINSFRPLEGASRRSVTRSYFLAARFWPWLCNLETVFGAAIFRLESNLTAVSQPSDVIKSFKAGNHKPSGNRPCPQQLALHRNALFQAQSSKSRIQSAHIHRAVPHTMLGQHLRRSRRYGFAQSIEHSGSSRSLQLFHLPFRSDQLFGQLRLTPALLHGC